MTSPMQGSPRSVEIVPLADRLRWMLVVRLAVVVGPIAAWLAQPEPSPWPLRSLLIPGVLHLLLTLVVHPLTVHDRQAARWAFSLPALADGIYLGWALYLTGGTDGPVVHMIALHVLAVTLLASFRTGMKLALWHSLVAMVVLESVSNGLLPSMGTGSGFDERRFAVFLGAVWLTAITTASLAAVNERELRRRRYDEEALRRFGLALHDADGGGKVAAALLEFAADAADAPVAAVHCRVSGHNGAADVDLAVRLRSGERLEPLRAVETPSSQSLLGTASASGGTMLADMRAPDAWVDEVLDGARRVVVVPFAMEGQVSGVLAFAHDARSGSRIERRRVALMEQAVAHAATAFARAALLERLQAGALTDDLTGVANRRAFDEALDRELEAARESDAELSVVLIDLDHFKSLNDRFGHLTGDDVLRGVGAALRGCIRQGDVVARYGGEEFALILPASTVDDAIAAAGRVRELLRDVVAPVAVTASLGIAALPAHGSTAAALLGAADEALYASKAGGRDQAHVAGVPGPVTGAAGGSAAVPSAVPSAVPAPRPAQEGLEDLRSDR